MTSPRPTLCLCMIVKNEAHVIARCLASVRPIIDHWIVVDTGSTDGTQDVVRAALADLPGEVIERPWVDFGHNRSEALALARPHGAYSLIMDADDELLLSPDYRLPELAADSYTVDIAYATITYRRPQVIRNGIEWRYRGVLHEFLECPEAKSADHLPILMRINHDGARSKDADTYHRDAALLKAALETETDPFLISRYTFYLAQSYRDGGDKDRAIAAYLRRAELGFWTQEVYCSLLNAARLMAALERPDDEILATYARATAVDPARAEAAHGASRFCRGRKRFAEAAALAATVLSLAPPDKGLFVEQWVYRYGVKDEYAVSAFWAGLHRQSLEVCLQLLAQDDLPDGYRARIAENARFALAKL